MKFTNGLKMIAFKVIILVALIQLLYRTEKTFLCSGIYSCVLFLFSLIFGLDFLYAILNAVFGFIFSSIYFWLLDYFSEGPKHWMIMIFGLLIGLV